MSNGDADICDQIRASLTAHSLAFDEVEIQNATKFKVRLNAKTASVNVFNTWKIHVEGKQHDLKEWLEQLKESVEIGGAGPLAVLPAEIEKFPQTLRERVPQCDDVILWFFQESLRCYKGDSIAGAVFLLGAASEKSIHLLVEAYGNAIKDDANRSSYFTRVNNKSISVKYEKFAESYAGCKSKPTDEVVTQDLSALLQNAFNFYRFTRNAVGHPQIVPDLDKGVVLANIGQFIVYIERIYALIDHFTANGVEV